MPNTERQWARRELERAANMIEWCGAHCFRVEERYRALHPEIADPLHEAQVGLIAIQELIEKVRSAI